MIVPVLSTRRFQFGAYAVSPQVAVTLGYLRPYFIQRILECLTPSSTSALPNSSTSWSPHSLAYIYAVLAFLSMSGQSLAQLQHFHLARRTGMRLRSELTVTIFEKVLVRRDMGGRVGGGEGGEEASAGKVVTLVSEDTDRVLRMVSSLQAKNEGEGKNSQLMNFLFCCRAVIRI